MTAKDRKEILQIFTEAFEKTAMPVLRRMQGDIKDLRTDVGVLKSDVRTLKSEVRDLTKKVGVLEQKMAAHAAEQVLMHKKINALFDVWDMDKKTLENHEGRITALEMGYARPSL